MSLTKVQHNRAKEPKIVVSEPTLTVLLAQDEDGSYCAKCPELDLVTQLPSAEAALKDLLVAVRDYAAEYLRERKLYSASPNRAHHRPYVEAIAACQTEWELRTLIEIKHGLVHV
nr:hypothetical protein [Nitrospirota bacterium]